MINLSKLRKHAKITQETIAKIIGCSKQAYAYWETGIREMSYDTMFKIADYYGVSIDYLLGHKTKNAGVMVTNEEAELLEMYRNLDKEDRALVMGELKGLTHAKEKKQKLISKAG